MADENAIILFDGVCNLCTGTVQFVLKRDKKNRFQFASLQSEAGQKLLRQFGRKDAEHLSSLVLIENGNLYTESTAALRIAKQMNGAWPMLYAFIIIPRLVRNNVYRWVAKNRYKWFGKKEECWLPKPEWQNRFLDQEVPAAISR